MKKWINANLEKLAFWSVLIAITWLLIGPALLAGKFMFDDNGNPGTIGDTIGGITGPVITLISVVLLYLTLIKQIESNEISKYQENFKLILSEIKDIRNVIASFTYQNKGGSEALSSISEGFLEICRECKRNQNTISIYPPNKPDLHKLADVIEEFNRILSFFDVLSISEDQELILLQDLIHHYEKSFRFASKSIRNWDISIEQTHLNGDAMLLYTIKQMFTSLEQDLLIKSKRINELTKR